MSSWDLTSTIGATSPKATGRADTLSKGGDGSGESFGKLFGRVFGDSPMRQSLAGGEVIEEASKIRMVLLGSDTQVITAGEPPTEEEILAFAREANLDETSLKALLLTAPGMLGDAGLSEEALGLDPLKDGLALAVVSGLNSVVGVEGLAGKGSSTMSPSPWTHLMASPADAGVASGKFGVVDGSAIPKPSTVAVADGSAIPKPSTVTVADGSEPFKVSVEAIAAKEAESGRSSKDVITSRLVVGDTATKEAPENKFAARLGLGLKAIEESVSMEALLKNIQEKKNLMLQDPIKLQLVDPARSPEPWVMDARLESGPNTDDPSRASAGNGGVGSLDSSMRSGGGSLGDSSQQSRSDPNAGPKAMSQQVMQRFGEILGQRLLQQINQGAWKVEIALEPADLGSIQIELEWRNGELEASFKVGQALTRDLLQDGLPRLRETLERAGIDVASVYVGDQGRQQSSSGRPGQPGSNDLKQSQSSDQGNGLEAQAAGPQGFKSDDGRLDVLV